MRTSRPLITTLAGAAALAFVAGCASSSATPESSPSEEGTPADFTYALVTPGAAGDGSFIDTAIAGAERAESELGVTGAVVEAESVSQQESVLRSTVATRPDIILAPGLDTESLLAVAEENPDQLFGVPSDIHVGELPDNVQAYSINMQDASYLGGYAAGSLTETGEVGAVLGIDNPGLNQFYYGYRQGVLDACPECEVTPTYLNGEFGDPAVGQEAALGLFQGGTDIVFAVAGLSGQGVFTAAEETGNFAIGVDLNQDDDAPGTVIASVMKRVDVTTYALIESAMNDAFTPGFVQAGIGEGFSGLSWLDGSTTFADEGPEAMASQVPDLMQEITSLQDDIVSGELEVCDALNDASSEICAELGVSG
ncbi:BMP family ABC transporter substrate-binding protein [Demequina sp. SO4-13]|uniref:BMP family ABC transporter substrate-binding protein n=1 Tax=Demequina sp. SO4-13 TaxID=3401027 RepID=UPI003AF62CDA